MYHKEMQCRWKWRRQCHHWTHSEMPHQGSSLHIRMDLDDFQKQPTNTILTLQLHNWLWLLYNWPQFSLCYHHRHPLLCQMKSLYLSILQTNKTLHTHITTVPGFTTHTALTLQLLFNQLIFYRLLHVRLGLPQVFKKELLLVDGVRFCRPDSLPVIQPTVPQSSERINLSIQIIHLIQTHYQISSY